jgi:hypothetical protein
LLLWLWPPLLRFRIRLFWPFLISRFLFNPDCCSQPAITYANGNTAAVAINFRSANPQCCINSQTHAPVIAQSSRRAQTRTLVRALDRQSVVLSSRRNIRLSFVPGH